MSDVVFMIVRIIFTVLAVIVSSVVVPALKKYVQSQENQQIYELIGTAVRAAEQTIKGSGVGALKKEQVLKFVSDWLASKGLAVREDQLDQMIEECVYLMNYSK